MICFHDENLWELNRIKRGFVLAFLVTLLPGFFGTHYVMSTMPMSVSCETAEYLPSRIDMLIYGNQPTSTSYALEAARYLQLKHNVENPEIARYYAFSLGEPRFAGEQASIVELGREENMRICRIDHVDEGTHDGVFLTGEDQIKGSDTDPSDGWTAPKGSFAIAGVMKPYQLQDDELVPDQEIYSYYKYQNGADTLIYTFTPAEGSDDGSKPFSIRKPVGIKRIDTPDQEAETEAAVYEFYNVFPADTLKTGTSYKVTVQAYDRKDVAIEGAACDFTLTR